MRFFFINSSYLFVCFLHSSDCNKSPSFLFRINLNAGVDLVSCSHFKAGVNLGISTFSLKVDTGLCRQTIGLYSEITNFYALDSLFFSANLFGEAKSLQCIDIVGSNFLIAARLWECPVNIGISFLLSNVRPKVSLGFCIFTSYRVFKRFPISLDIGTSYMFDNNVEKVFGKTDLYKGLSVSTTSDLRLSQKCLKAIERNKDLFLNIDTYHEQYKQAEKCKTALECKIIEISNSAYLEQENYFEVFEEDLNGYRSLLEDLETRLKKMYLSVVHTPDLRYVLFSNVQLKVFKAFWNKLEDVEKVESDNLFPATKTWKLTKPIRKRTNNNLVVYNAETYFKVLFLKTLFNPVYMPEFTYQALNDQQKLDRELLQDDY